MRDVYTSHATALREALRHAVERGGQSSLAVLHQGEPPAATLTGDDASAQAGRIRRQLERLAPLTNRHLDFPSKPIRDARSAEWGG